MGQQWLREEPNVRPSCHRCEGEFVWPASFSAFAPDIAPLHVVSVAARCRKVNANTLDHFVDVLSKSFTGCQSAQREHSAACGQRELSV